jgi:hypothetical protein
MKRILFQPWGGLGDNFQYSTLPERFSELGDEFYISDKNVYRNPLTYDLVWGTNPYVKGISTEMPNVGANIPFIPYVAGKTRIYNWEICHGLEAKNELPKLYYNPNLIKELENVVLVDFSGYTEWIVPDNLDEILKENFGDRKIIIPTSKFSNKQCQNFRHDEKIETQSLFHFADMIHSCYYFVCSFSGNAVLASALNKQNTTCFEPKPNLFFSDFKFPNINYE